MKMPFYPLGSAMLALAGLATVAGFAPGASGPMRPTRPSETPDFDQRVVAAKSVERLAERNAGFAGLRQRLPGASVSFDSLLDTPKFIRARGGFLTGPGGQGFGVASQAYSVGDPHRAVRAFLDEHVALFGHGAEVLATAALARESVGAHNGLRTVVWQQQHAGLPLFGAVLIGNISKNGELVTLASQFLPDPAAAAGGVTAAEATVSASQAIIAALASLGDTVGANEISALGAAGSSGYDKFAVRNTDLHGRMVWLPMSRSSLRLAWELHVTNLRTREVFRMLVDAQTGVVVMRHNLTCHISDATYNVFTGDSPAPWSPVPCTPTTTQPPLVNRTMVTLAALSVAASPNGWINDGDNETRGNNVDAFLDRNEDGQPDGPRPQGTPPRTFDFPLDLTQSPLSYTNASVVQLFYRVNWYHDRLYSLGFTETAGNYQNDNFGQGGQGNDAISARAQAGADLGFFNNAFFVSAPDGIPGQIHLFLCDGPDPDRDTALDADWITHELTHGTSGRLVGGGVGITALQSGGMGEGWSDFYDITMLSEAGDDPTACYSDGGYADYLFFGLTQNYYFGDRHYPYSTDLTRNPLTFKDIDPAQASTHVGVPTSPLYGQWDPTQADEVHNQGEVWCVTLWETRVNLVTKYGWPVGNELTLQLVTDGMKLSPANPNFLEARDAILLADEVNNGGANTPAIWAGFAKRGMGFSATSPSSDTTAGVVEAYDVPGLQVDHVILSGGNGNGAIDVNECNQLDVILKNNSAVAATGVSVRLTTTNRGVAFGNKFANYGSVAVGEMSTNQIPFSISTSPDFICGTPIRVTVTIKSDQVTSTSTLTFTSGTNGPPLRFDSLSPIAIPDADPRGTNSPIVVSNLTSAISKVSVSLYLTHTYDWDLTLQLISPDGVTNTLSRANGGSGNNYGAGCAPDPFRTTFDDDAAVSITGGSPPFVGSYMPEEPLSVFAGKAGTNVNGTWQLRVVDGAGFDIGVLQCWSLFLSVAQCADGGGGCPGADLGVAITDTPDPSFVGSNLVYTITVTNLGPNSAKNTVVTHQLPSSALFLSAVASQGACVFSGGAVIANLGTVPFEGAATITVTVMPTTVGVISSSASIASSESDPDPVNNTASTTTRINPPTAELALGLLAAPNPALVGGSLTYSLTVTNHGPSTASGVTVSNTLPISANVQSAAVSQGAYSINGNVVVFTLGSLVNGGRATGTITVMPTAQGSITATATVSANQADPIQANNTRSAATVIGPASDLAIGVVDSPNPVVVRSNWTYTIGVTNLGPSVADSVVVNATIANGVTVLSTNTTLGSIARNGNTVTASLGSMNSGAAATITILANATNVGVYPMSAVVSAAAADPNPTNSAAATATVVAAPNVTIAAAGATLTSESLAPANGALDNGETVTLTLRLRNAGNVNNTNLTATLLATNGVASPSGAQNYGVLTPSGANEGRSFTFTASGANGGNVSPTLQLQDGPNNLGLVAFHLSLSDVHTYSNAALITIIDPLSDSNPAAASPYPSTIGVSGLTGLVGRVSVTLSNLNHTYLDDVDVLLVGPSGQKVILMSDAGGGNSVVNTTVTFDDAGAVLPDENQVLATIYAPADYQPGDTFPAPAPAGPYGTNLSAFNGNSPNGSWSLYVVDDHTGDVGNIANGWRLAITTVTPINQLADLKLSVAATPSPAKVGSPLTYVFTATNAGPNTASGIGFTDLLPGGVTLISATASQGVVVTNSSSVFVSLGSLSAGASATVSVVIVPGTAGLLGNSASVSASEIDLNPADNAVSASTSVILPIADLGLTISAAPTATVGSNITYTVVLTNRGPETAVNAQVSDPLPAGLTFVSATGAATNAAGTVIAGIGNLASGDSASFTIVANAGSLGAVTNTATVTSGSSDANPADNAASAVVAVSPPAPLLVAAGVTLISESFTPANGTIDLRETVTVALSVRNVGNANTTNVWGVLQPTGGVTNSSAPRNYGVLVAGGPALTQNFTFTAAGTNGGIVTAALLLDDQGPVGTVEFLFNLPSLATFANTNAIVIPDHGAASPYPSVINVSGLTGLVGKVAVTLTGLTHGFPDDLDLLLVGPSGQKVVIMSDAGGGHALANVNLTLADGAGALPDSGQISGTNYGPTDYEAGDNFPAPAPAGAVGNVLSLFNGADANGDWSLYVVDDATGDAGVIAGGWSLAITTVQTVSPVADLAVTLNDAPDPAYVGSALVYTITVTNRGPAAVSGATVSDTLPAGLNYVSSTSSLGVVGAVGSQLTANLGGLAAGSGAVITIRTAPSSGGLVVNTASATAAQLDLNPANNSAQTSTQVIAPAPARFVDVVFTNSTLQATLLGEPGQTYVIHAAAGFTTWSAIFTNTTAANGTFKFVDADAPGFGERFYRAVRVIP